MAGQGGEGIDGVNPNVDVGGEGEATTSGGGEIGFDDIEEVERAKPKKKDDEGGKKPVESKVKDENGARAAPKEKKEEGEGKGGKEGGGKKAGVEAKPDPNDSEDGKEGKGGGRPKTFKGKHGEAEVAVSGATVFSIPVEGGKTEEMTFQEVMNEVHGKRYHERKTKQIEEQDRARRREHDDFNHTIKTFMETAQKDRDAGWDFLAELTATDPVKFKMDLLRSQIAEILPLARMDEHELESWMKDKEREFKDKSLNRRAKSQEDKEAQGKAGAERAEAAQKYGIEDWEGVSERVAEYRRGKGDRTPVSNRDVIVASRLEIAHEAIQEVAPHLAQHKNYASIFDDIVSDLLRHPGLSRERLKATLKETFGGQDDNRTRENLKATSERIQRSAQASGTPSHSRAKDSNAHETFEDL